MVHWSYNESSLCVATWYSKLLWYKIQPSKLIASGKNKIKHMSEIIGLNIKTDWLIGLVANVVNVLLQDSNFKC